MYGKVFGSLFEGSMRGNPNLILVFVNMLCRCNPDGSDDRHHRVIADETGLPLPTVREAITTLESPDLESRTPDHEGRRIMRLDDHRDWGWQIVNYAKYQAMRDEEGRREYMRKYMSEYRSRKQMLAPVNTGKPQLAPVAVSVAVSESVTTTPPLPPKGDANFDRFWIEYPKKTGKKAAQAAWLKAKDKPAIGKIVSAIQRAISSDQWLKDNGQYIPNPATWINQGRWDDQPTTVAAQPAKPETDRYGKPVYDSGADARNEVAAKALINAELRKMGQKPI